MAAMTLSGTVPAVGIQKKCNRKGCTCENTSIPITEILYGKEHPKHFHSPVKKEGRPIIESPFHVHISTETLKKLSRKFPRVYKLVKERNGEVSSR